MTPTVQGTFHVKRLHKDATGANTINLYRRVALESECEIEKEGVLAGDIETERTELNLGIEIEPSHPFLPDVDVLPGPEPVMGLSIASPRLGLDMDLDSVPFVAEVQRPPTPEPVMRIVIPPPAELGLDLRVGPEKPRTPQLEDDVDAAAMAHAMREAARLGIPFCEKCTRARLRRATIQPPTLSPAPPPPTLGDDVDAAAMAAAMREAARLGLPFCEKCTRARLKQEAEARERAAQTVSAPTLKTAPPPPTLPKRQRPAEETAPDPAMADVDAAAMAQAMKDAARLGVPFCEKCTRARLKQEREGRHQ